ncbi:MAG: DUF1318 domain-containing protein [Verrucomicrobiota bacterium]
MNRRSFFLFFLLLPFLAFSASAQDLKAVKASMGKRLAMVDKLKAAGRVGESNKGFLEARVTLTSGEKATVKAENDDRKTVYGAIGKKSGKSALIVGQQRAITVRKASKKGVWLQAGDGKWYRKS